MVLLWASPDTFTRTTSRSAGRSAGGLERAGIKAFRWHDLRHTWATWHVLHGTSLHELKELGGWQSLEMVLRYTHLVDNDHLAGVVKRFSGLRLADGGQRGDELATLPAVMEGSA